MALALMGSGRSALSAAGEPLSRLASRESISKDDAIWDTLFEFQLPENHDSDVEISEYLFAFCAEMVVNNRSSGNFQTLILKMLDQLQKVVKLRLPANLVRQSCGCVFLFHIFLKHMVETLKPEVRTRNETVRGYVRSSYFSSHGRSSV